MELVRRLFESRPFEELEPDPAMIVGGPTSGGSKIRAARARDGSFAFIYSPMGEPFAVDDTRLSGHRIKQIWCDPRYGVAHHFHTATTSAFQGFTPPQLRPGARLDLDPGGRGRRLPPPRPPRPALSPASPRELGMGVNIMRVGKRL